MSYNFNWKKIMSEVTYKNLGIILAVVVFTVLGMAGISASKYTFATQSYSDKGDKEVEERLNTKIDAVEKRFNKRLDCSTAELQVTILVEKVLNLEAELEKEGDIRVKELKSMLDSKLKAAQRTLEDCGDVK